MGATEVVVARLSDAKKVSFGPDAFYRRLLAGGDVPLVTGVQTCQPGYATALHAHPYVEVLFVLEGESIVWQEGREAEANHLKAGDMIALPPTVRHAFRNPGPTVLNMLGIHCSPERIVDYANGGRTWADGYASYDATGNVISKPASQLPST